jgi:hypothetical protein
MRIYPETKLHQLALREKKVRPDSDLIKPTYYTHDYKILAHVACSLALGSSEIFQKIRFT